MYGKTGYHVLVSMPFKPQNLYPPNNGPTSVYTRFNKFPNFAYLFLMGRAGLQRFILV